MYETSTIFFHCTRTHARTHAPPIIAACVPTWTQHAIYQHPCDGLFGRAGAVLSILFLFLHGVRRFVERRPFLICVRPSVRLSLLDAHCPSSHAYRKPEPGIYLLACERNGIKPTEAVFLDDLGM